MRRALNLAAAAGLAAVLAALAIAQGRGPASGTGLTFMGESVTAEDLLLGKAAYAAHCAACHGADLEGQPDWRRRQDDGRMPAPPHDASGHTWHHSDQALFAITKHGLGAVVPGYESDMPAFGGMLSDAEIAAVLGYIKSTWPQRERLFQAEVTKDERGS